MRVRAVIQGVVQGVGFRPYLYRLAGELDLAGQAANSGQGVELELEGAAERIESFFDQLIPRKPPLAHIVRVEREEVPETGQGLFEIVKSRGSDPATALVPPDVAVCGDCLTEMLDPADRRFGYPFINCTNCGPRYTIIRGLPYDRPLTTMAGFEMCPDCRAEYEDPADRRFHAQPNACPVCGPRVWAAGTDGWELADEPLGLAADYLRAGKVVAVKGLGGFHLACDATNEAAVKRLRQRKRREEKPLAVMVRDPDAARRLVIMDRADEDLLTSPSRPIILLPARPDHGLAESVAPGLKILGVMIAYTPLHHLLLERGPEVLVMTSGNLTDEPIVVSNNEALDRLSEVADLFLFHDREIHTRADDSVACPVLGQPRLVRRARGYVPHPIRFPNAGPNILALGPELKNTVCLTRGEDAFLSAHVGDLKDAETQVYYRRTIDRLRDLVGVEPEALAVDLHPDYLSTQEAAEYPELPVVRVQHHAAHILSVAAELGIEGEFLGLALDGTGWGCDGTIWGGELLSCGPEGFGRLGRLRRFRLAGGDAAVKEPWRTGLGLVRMVDDGNWPDQLPDRFIKNLNDRGIGTDQLATLEIMMAKPVNSPLTSSLGRLFDGLAALIGVRMTAAYEAQPAILLEGLLDPVEPGAYPFPVNRVESGTGTGLSLELDSGPMVLAALDDQAQGVDPGRISARFHHGLIQGLVEMARLAAGETGLKRILLSGGCFMNRALLAGLVAGLEKIGLNPGAHRDVPTNDGGVSLGQALAARYALAAGDHDLFSDERKG